MPQCSSVVGLRPASQQMEINPETAQVAPQVQNWCSLLDMPNVSPVTGARPALQSHWEMVVREMKLSLQQRRQSRVLHELYARWHDKLMVERAQLSAALNATILGLPQAPDQQVGTAWGSHGGQQRGGRWRVILVSLLRAGSSPPQHERPVRI